MGRRVLTAEQDEEIIAANAGGETVQELRRRYGVSQWTIDAVFARRGLKPWRSAKTSWRLSPEQKEEAARLYDSGCTLENLAARYRTAISSIHAIIGRRTESRGWELQTKITNEQRLECCSLYQGGLTLREVAARFGVDLTLIALILKANGMERRKAQGLEHSKRMSATRQGIPVEEWEEYLTVRWQKFKDTPEYKAWRLAVFQRDGFKCQECGAKDKSIQAHHIWPKAKYPQLCLIVANGITLCRGCHDGICRREEELAEGYLRKLGSTIYPLHFIKRRVK